MSYYFNESTNETTWDRPGQPLLDGWEELIDEAYGLLYYFNDTTNETTWESSVVLEVSAAAAATHLDRGNGDTTA